MITELISLYFGEGIDRVFGVLLLERIFSVGVGR
jgi:hypothetical protein